MRYLFVCLFMGLCTGLFAQEMGKLSVEFVDLENNEGSVLALVQDISEKEIVKMVLPIYDNRASVTLHLPNGKYAITAFHDINGNEKLDKNFIGVPSEPYGFSNNERNLLSKPEFEKMLVTLKGSASTSFKLDYYP